MPEQLDHLVYAVPDLDAGLDHIERLLGVRPVPGGRHPGYGTRNALLSLGDGIYFEVIAPDPEQSDPPRGVLFGLDQLEAPRLLTWVLRTDDIEALAGEATGIGLGAISEGHRQKPDGTLLRWKLTDPYAMPLDGAVPFLISWGDTPHPSGSLPRAGTLAGLRIEHPQPQAVRDALALLGVSLEVRAADRYRMVAVIDTPRGVVELE